ncbi:MAG: hypothetical protein EAZ85_08955 [Bacteroidetes bacterium]|nr:MAG: hypothetical protein EAZ85_08955 [Bacteroidota bacterium]TAG93882.1 MAG: hypothetical protein EAZ20_01345 [Bacteroidota bacterium]
MRFLLITCFSLFLFTHTSAQNNYIVLFFDGNIKINQKYIDIGTKININDEIIFENRENKVLLMNQKKEKFILDFKKYETRKKNIIKDVIVAVQNTEKIRTRCIDCPTEKSLQASLGLQKSGEATKFIIIGDKYTLKYKCPEDKCLFLATHYIDNNRKPSVLKLAYTDINYNLDKSIFKGLSDSVAYCQLFEIQYEDFSRTKNSQKINKGDFEKKENIKAIFEPIYTEKKQLKNFFSHYLSLVDIDQELIKYEKANQENLSQEIQKILSQQPQNIKKIHILEYFLSICYQKPDENGNIDVNKVKIDYEVFQQFLNEK